MKTFATVPVTVAPTGAIRQPRTVYYRIKAKRSLLKRFRHFIESTGWERHLCRKGIDKVCWAILCASLLYFAPILGSVLLSGR
jgi:hypothetical protein